VTWTDWFVAGFFPGLPLILLLPRVVYKMFPMTSDLGMSCSTFARDQLKAMGPMTRQEKSTAIIMGLTLLMWATEFLHGINATKSSFLLVALLFPGIGAVTWKDINNRVSWPALIWLGFAMGMANLINKFGGFKSLVEVTLAGNPIFEGMGLTSFLLILIPIIVFIHFMFAGMNAMMLIVLPITIALANQFGFDPYVVGLISSMALSVGAFFMPFNSAPNLLFYGTGRYTGQQQLKGAFPLAIMACLVLIAALKLWWPLVGIV
jgi:DASS family divalent anion:Na+ symporter